MFGRLVTLVRKELALALRDPQTRQLLIFPVILQLAVFPFAATLEVKNSTLAILDQDGGAESRELVERFAAAAAFPHVRVLRSNAELREVVDDQQAQLALEFPADFSRSVVSGRPAELLAVVDGRRSNSAQIALGYVQSIVAQYSAERAAAAGAVAAGTPAGRSTVIVRNEFNPNLEYRWFLMPVLVAIMTTLASLIGTALSIAREREQGTLDQLLVSPLTPGLIMLGKTIPSVLIALVQATVIALAAAFVFRVPFHGSIPLLYLGMVCYSLSLAGFGLFISSICETQQQAFLGTFAFVVPAIMLSGFIGPVENMPPFFRAIAYANPLTHFVVIVKGLFLKGYGLELVLANLWPLLVITLVTVSIAYGMFRRRVA